MDITLTVIFGLLGLAVGSFLNVCIDRIPAGKSLLYPPSHCDACQHPLSPRDLFPVVSYLWLRGRCRYCGAKIPRRPLLVEAATGLLFAFLYWHYGLTAQLPVTAVYCSIFIVIMFIDLKHKIIPNKIVYPAALLAPVINAFLPPWIVRSLIGGAVGFAFLLIPAIINPNGMGFGDVKMAGLIGLVTGFPLVLVSLVMGVVAGGLVAVALLLLRVKTRKETIPFGPFLSLATIATLLWGNQILVWYLALY